MFRRSGILVAAVAMAVALAPTAAATPTPAPVAASAPYCGITWGSQSKTASWSPTVAVLTGIRAGRHACFDRLVFDVQNGEVAGFQVRYVASVTTPFGHVVPLRGGAKLSIKMGVSDYAGPAQPRFRCPEVSCTELVDVSGYPTFRQVSHGGAHLGNMLMGLGVRATLPFRAYTLPGRLVIDVAHRW
ncbi:AMIN-like domain-containing (lipo)protein [Actinokineospora sp. 24-640]